MKRVSFLIILMAILGVIVILALDSFKVISVPSFDLNVLTTPTTTAISGPVILESIQNTAQLETVSMVVANDRDITKVWGLEGACRESVTYLGCLLYTSPSPRD